VLTLALFVIIGILLTAHSHVRIGEKHLEERQGGGATKQMERHTSRDKKTHVSPQDANAPPFQDGITMKANTSDKFALKDGEEVFYMCPGNTRSGMSKYLPTDFQVCDFDLTRHLEYLPTKKYLDAVSEHPPNSWREDENWLESHIQRLQYPEDCNSPQNEDSNRWHLVKLIQAGIGFNIYLFTDVVARHWESGLSVMVNMNNRWRFSDLKCGRGSSCHLKKLTSCSIEDIQPQNLVAITHHGPPWPTLANICENGKYIPSKGRCLCNEGYIPHESGENDPACIEAKPDRDRIPDEEEAMDGPLPWGLAAPGEVDTGGSGCPHAFPAVHKLRYKHGFFWWHAVHLNYLIRNADNYPKLEKWAVSNRLDHKNGNTCIAVHVRHGDACLDKYSLHRTCHDWKEYAEKIKILEERYGHQQTIFVATDDQKIIEEAKKDKEHNVVFQEISREKYKPKGWGHTIDVRDDLNKPKVVTEFIQDVVGLGMCGMFVGTFTSSVAWIAVELQAARLGHYAPFIALDMPYAHERNVGRFLTWQDQPHPETKQRGLKGPRRKK